MKKVLLTAIMGVFAMVSNAQVWVGGSLGFDYTDVKDAGSVTSVSFAPEVGYNLNDKWAIGISIEEQYVNVSPEHGSSDNGNNFAIAPFARYTFANSGKVSFFVDGGVIFGSTEFNTSNGFQKFNDSESYWGIGIRPGVKIGLTDRLSLVTKLGYFGYQHMEDINEFGFGIDNNSISFGAIFSF
ncbi:MAG: porin family protein [Prevotellaceae bacterium]|nr:porin family protein [Prevotellaceae bacterium]